jgi:catechol 2,3-dioxygenase-like lactoylglutathione lyase family enzyme
MGILGFKRVLACVVWTGLIAIAASGCAFSRGDLGVPLTNSDVSAIKKAEFDAIFGRIKEAGIPYESGPFSQEDMQINTRRGGRGVYFKDPDGHLLELMTRT